MTHPCLSCGACCACFRVAFHWSEAEAGLGGSVPPELTERLDPHRLAMRGTQAREPRCQMLLGVPGDRVACGIYAQRPSPCRELVPAWENGEPSPQCDRARQRHGMAVLTPDSWTTSLPGTGIDPISVCLPPASPPASAVHAVDLDQQLAAADFGVQQQPLH